MPFKFFDLKIARIVKCSGRQSKWWEKGRKRRTDMVILN